MGWTQSICNGLIIMVKAMLKYVIKYFEEFKTDYFIFI